MGYKLPIPLLVTVREANGVFGSRRKSEMPKVGPCLFWISFSFFQKAGLGPSQRDRTCSLSASPKRPLKCPACTSLTRALIFLPPPFQPPGSKRLLFICTFKSRLPPVIRSSQAPGWCKKSPARTPPPI